MRIHDEWMGAARAASLGAAALALGIAACGGGGGSGDSAAKSDPGAALAKFSCTSYFPVVENATWAYGSSNSAWTSGFIATVQVQAVNPSLLQLPARLARPGLPCRVARPLAWFSLGVSWGGCMGNEPCVIGT